MPEQNDAEEPVRETAGGNGKGGSEGGGENKPSPSADAPPRKWEWPELLLLGTCAGAVTVAFPPAVALLTSPADGSLGLLSNPVYVAAGTVLTLIVGVSMVWLNVGRTETPGNLYMTALALPAILSGSINVAHVNTSNVQHASEAAYFRGAATQAEEAQQAAELQARKLIDQVTRENSVTTYDFLPGYVPPPPPDSGPEIGFRTPGAAPPGAPAPTLLARLLGPRPARAAGPPPQATAVRPEVADSLRNQRYITVLKKAESRQALEPLRDKIAQDASLSPEIIGEGTSYFLILPEPKAKADALLDGVNLKGWFPVVEPGLYRVR